MNSITIQTKIGTPFRSGKNQTKRQVIFEAFVRPGQTAIIGADHNILSFHIYNSDRDKLMYVRVLR